MLISHKHKLITIDIPKTGTRSLRESLCPLGVVDIVGKPFLDSDFYQHSTALQIKNSFKTNNWDWCDYFKFTIVRNPWDRYFSFFKYFHSYKDKYLNKSKDIIWDKAAINQGQYCVELFQKNSNYKIMKSIIDNHLPQSDFFLDNNDNVIVDHVANFDNFQNEFTFLCNFIGINTPTLKHNNKSVNSLCGIDVYNKQLIDLVEQKEQFVIKLKNYQYN